MSSVACMQEDVARALCKINGRDPDEIVEGFPLWHYSLNETAVVMRIIVHGLMETIKIPAPSIRDFDDDHAHDFNRLYWDHLCSKRLINIVRKEFSERDYVKGPRKIEDKRSSTFLYVTTGAFFAVAGVLVGYVTAIVTMS